MTDAIVLAGRYRLDRKLGEGAMGRVWLGYDLLIHRKVAIKQMLGTASDVHLVERAMREARSAGSLLHPNVVAVYDLLLVDDLPHVVMEYVDGTTLADRMELGIPSPIEVASLGSQVAAGLSAAHLIGIVHRDIKPANILIDKSGNAKLADFGIARIESNPGMTGTGMLIGTVAYMAPEVALGEPVGPPADVWSLGATLFAAVEGRPVYEGTSPVSVLSQLLTKPVPTPSLRGPLGELITEMLDRDPARRPSAAQTQRRLAVLAQPGDAAATVVLTAPDRPHRPGSGADQRPPQPRGRRRGIAIVAAIVGVLALGIVAAVIALSDRGTRHPAAAAHTTSGSGVTGAPRTSANPRSSSTRPAPEHASTPSGVAPPSARATDLAGDGEPDVRAVDWRVTATDVTVAMHYARQLPATVSTYAIFYFDVDNKPSTGCNGAELTVSYYSDGTQPTSYSSATCTLKINAFGVGGRVTSDGIELTIPRSAFASSGAAVHFSALTANLDNDKTDYVPALGTGELAIALR
ncbi:MAG: serine/threonine-protein kinase [Pseudonocardiales bacterium]